MLLKVLEHKADLILEMFGSIKNLLGFLLCFDLNRLSIDLEGLRFINMSVVSIENKYQ